MGGLTPYEPLPGCIPPRGGAWFLEGHGNQAAKLADLRLFLIPLGAMGTIPKGQTQKGNPSGVLPE